MADGASGHPAAESSQSAVADAAAAGIEWVSPSEQEEERLPGEAKQSPGAGEAAAAATPGLAPAVLLFCFTLFQSFFTTGIVYGWPSFLLLLKSEGVFADRCHDGLEDCPDRSIALNAIFTWGATLNVAGGPVVGLVVDRLGPKRSMVLGVSMSLLASVAMSLGVVKASFDGLWSAAYAVYGIGGSFVHLASFSLGNAFGSAKGCIIACMVACFSCSSLAFQLVYIAYDSLELSRRTVFFIHVGIQAFNCCMSFWLWPSQPLKPTDRLAFSGCRMLVVSIAAAGAAPAAGAAGAPGGPLRLQLRKFMGFVLSRSYLCFMVFHACQLWFNRCLMGWFEAELEWKREESGGGLDVAMHLGLFNATQSVCGMMMIPIFGMIVARFGHRSAPFFATSVLGVTWMAFNLIPREWPLYIVYAFSSWHRQFFFSTFFTFVAAEFPPHVFGKLAGLASLLAGLATSTQNPLLDLTMKRLDGDFTVPMAIQLGMACALCGVALTLFLRERCGWGLSAERRHRASLSQLRKCTA